MLVFEREEYYPNGLLLIDNPRVLGWRTKEV